MPARPVSTAFALPALLGLTLAAWLVGLCGEFQFDDVPNIVLDPATSQLPALWQRLDNGFRPLLRLSYVADHALWGFDAAGFLATNLLLHLGCVWGVWRLALQRLPTARAAFIAALWFALQPAHAAVVASASGRSTGLSTLLMVWALLAHERAIATSTQVRWRAVSLAMFVLAVTAKEVALVFPALLLLWELTRAPRPRTSVVWRRMLPASVTALLLAALAFTLSPRLREIVAYSRALGAPLDALATHAAALPYSLGLWFRPWALTIEHAPLAADAWLPGTVALLAIAVSAVFAWRRGAPMLTLALLWPLVMLLPTHSVLARLDPVVEKALYPAWIGPSLGIAWLLDAALRRRALIDDINQRRMARAAAGVATIGLVLCCAWRAAQWADPVALWLEATEHAPQSARAWHNRALTEFGARRFDAAASSIEHAQSLDGGTSRSHDLALAISVMRPAPPPSSHASPPTTETPP